MLTRAPDPVQVAHLFPFSLRNESSLSRHDCIWKTLEFFWEKERVKAWHDAVFEEGTEAVFNLLCFAPSVHAYHERALFALQPGELSEDGRCQIVKFHWLYPQQHGQLVDLTRAPDIPQPSNVGPRQMKLSDMPTNRLLCSGDEIRLTTPDPDGLPLPNKNILDMQWTLQQVAALKGGGELSNDDNDDDDEDWEAVLAESPDIEEWILSTSTPSPPEMNSTPPSSISPTRQHAKLDTTVVGFSQIRG